MLGTTFSKCTFLIIFYSFVFLLSSSAQLKADFVADKSEGCSPFSVSFINTSKGASPSAIFQWDFGNGNSSTLKNSGAIFQDEKNYTVTLTVTDSGKTSVKNQVITVYKKPLVDFTSSLQKGCIPLPVVFTSNVVAGDGTITNYFWDFGDGVTQAGQTGTMAHSYKETLDATVSLTVLNNYGCQSTLVKQRIVSVNPELTADFSVDKKVLCTISDAALFTNKSVGPGTLTYLWDFGDGTTSTAFQPFHIFAAAGTYSISLTVNSSLGCIASSTQKALINVANFKSDIEIEGPICELNYNKFTSKSFPLADSSFWDFGDGYTQFSNSGDSIMNHGYATAGQYKIKLTNTFGYCKDVVTKLITVNNTPDLKGFLVDITRSCGAPVTVNFKDTTSTAVKWEWSANYLNFNSTIQAPSYNFLNSYDDYITLKVFNAAGCSDVTNKPIKIVSPSIQIVSPDEAGNGEILSCGPKNVHFNTMSTDTIANYLWDFGDGATSTEATPIHLYDKVGMYYVNLNYTTVNGCKGTAVNPRHVVIRNKVKADFSISNTNICGNTPVTITNNSGATDYYFWDLGTGNFEGMVNGQYGSFLYQFQQEGVFTLRLIATDLICADTMTKISYVKVSPPFPKIAGFTNTCDGTRGEVTFTQSSRQVVTGTWDFGDGTVPQPYIDVPQIKHTYTKTGTYKVLLSTTNGQCTVKDSIIVNVLLKQHPVLSADRTIVCSMGEEIKLIIDNLESMPPGINDYYRHYSTNGFYRNDGSFALGNYDQSNGYYLTSYTDTSLYFSMHNLTPGKEGLYSIVRTGYYSCYDTTNIIPLKIKGPIPGFKTFSKPCSNGNVVFFQDTSKPQNGVALTSWEWNFQDGTLEKYNSQAEFGHQYYYAQPYLVSVKVTDAEGCSSYFIDTVLATAQSLKAAFTTSANTVSPGSSVSFINTSETSDINNTTYRWLLGDGTIVNDVDATKQYFVPGTYQVKLIATNSLTGCADTATTTILVKFVNAAFSINASYINSGKCPPVLVSFTNNSNNVSKIIWDFGDGTIVTNVFNPTHVYTKAGFYKVSVTTYSDNNTVYFTEDSVKINDLSVKINTDILHSCTAQSITLSAITENASNYLWDFGDGTVVQATDTFSVHYYSNAGVYTPKLIVKNAEGCPASATLADKIVIDSLYLSLDNLPQKICTPKDIIFNATIVNIAADQAQQSLLYHWNFGTGNSQDTSNIKNPSFMYQQPGEYPVNLKVQSPYGCIKEVKTTIVAKQGLGAQINGPLEICQESFAQFTGTTQLPGQPKWLWIFDDGTIVNQQNPPTKKYNDSGNFVIKLVADNGGCIDTVTRSLTVHAKPAISLSTQQAIVCEGSQSAVTANGASSYTWSPSTGLGSTNSATINASPLINTTYTVTATNDFGCSNKDSVQINVVHPFVLDLKPEEIVCNGKSVTLKALGAGTYKWLNNNSTLSNVNIGNPIATPNVTTVYTVVGTDENKCFTDTADIKVIVMASPTVNAGQGAEILAGTSYQLQPICSNDVVIWSWTPGSFLSCINCATPQAKANSPITYELTVANAYGCTASDTVSIALFCSESRIRIPKAFSPNNDGINDQFSIMGDGIRLVNHLSIFDRWGALIFERSNFQIGDKNAAWDGRNKGSTVPAGAYVYIALMSCNEKTFTQKGTVTVLY